MRRIGREFDSSYSCVMVDKSSHKGSAQKFGEDCETKQGRSSVAGFSGYWRWNSAGLQI